jgi:thiol:disulfide interchange protein
LPLEWGALALEAGQQGIEGPIGMRGFRYFNCLLAMAATALCISCEIREQAQDFAPPSPQAAGSGARGHIVFVKGYANGCQLARDQQKPMLIFFTAQWCKYCHQMASEAFIQDPVVNLSQRFVCVLVDADADAVICREFEVRSFPTIQFVSARGVRLNRVIGKQPAHQLVAQMQAALAALARRPELTIER